MKNTLKLYDLDSFTKEFSAIVLSCQERENGYAVVLDQTAFFPEGGGQPSDTGYLKDVRVFDVQIENEVIVHYTDLPLQEGSAVTGTIDFARRFDFMQNHSGEHIVSGVVHRLFGLDNVGFHLGEDVVTLDFNGLLTREQILAAELEANRAVWENRTIKTWYPDEGELSSLLYRSKKELDGAIRMVEIEGTDLCACCAPHVKTTGQIGLIKLLDTEKMRGGTRIFMKCGNRSLADYNCKYDNVREIGNLLSSKQEETAEAVVRLNDQLTAEKQKNAALKRRLIEQLVSASEERFVCEDGLDGKELQLLADGLFREKSGICGAFTPTVGGFAFALCGEEKELNGVFAKFKKQFSVRGGGRNGLVQGTVQTDLESLNSYFHF